MTLTVNVKFETTKTIEEVFAIAQKVVNTPQGYEPIVEKDSISNPLGIGADALMQVDKLQGGEMQVSFDQPYSACHTMPVLIKNLIKSLEIENYKVFDEFKDVWHENDFSFIQIK